MTSLQTGKLLTMYKTHLGHYMMEGEHHVFFLSKEEGFTHTLYLEDAENPEVWGQLLDRQSLVIDRDRPVIDMGLEKRLKEHFEKLYFDDDDYDWWEKESTDAESD